MLEGVKTSLLWSAIAQFFIKEKQPGPTHTTTIEGVFQLLVEVSIQIKDDLAKGETTILAGHPLHLLVGQAKLLFGVELLFTTLVIVCIPVAKAILKREERSMSIVAPHEWRQI